MPQRREKRYTAPMSTQQPTICVQVNGEAWELSQGTTCAEVLQRLGVPQQRRLAVEVNEAIVPRSQLAEHQLADGDRLEVIQAIGGG